MKKPKKESFTEKYGLNPSSDDYLKGPFVKVFVFIVLTIIIIYSISNSDYSFLLGYIYLIAPFALFLIPLFLWVQYKDWKIDKERARVKQAKEAQQKLMAQEQFTVNGYVIDINSKELIIGANITIPEMNTGLVTNSKGFFTISLPEGNYTIQVSSMGSKEQTIEIKLNKNTSLGKISI